MLLSLLVLSLIVNVLVLTKKRHGIDAFQRDCVKYSLIPKEYGAIEMISILKSRVNQLYQFPDNPASYAYVLKALLEAGDKVGVDGSMMIEYGEVSFSKDIDNILSRKS